MENTAFSVKKLRAFHDVGKLCMQAMKICQHTRTEKRGVLMEFMAGFLTALGQRYKVIPLWSMNLSLRHIEKVVAFASSAPCRSILRLEAPACPVVTLDPPPTLNAQAIHESGLSRKTHFCTLWRRLVVKQTF